MSKTETTEGVSTQPEIQLNKDRFVSIKGGAKLSGMSQSTIRRFAIQNKDNSAIVKMVKYPKNPVPAYFLSISALEKRFPRISVDEQKGLEKMVEEFMTRSVEEAIVRKANDTRVQGMNIDQKIAEARTHLTKQIRDGKYLLWLKKHNLKDNKTTRKTWAIKVVENKLIDLQREYGTTPAYRLFPPISPKEDVEDMETGEMESTGDPLLDTLKSGKIWKPLSDFEEKQADDGHIRIVGLKKEKEHIERLAKGTIKATGLNMEIDIDHLQSFYDRFSKEYTLNTLKGIQELPDFENSVVWYRMHGYSWKNTAEILGESEQKVREAGRRASTKTRSHKLKKLLLE